MFRQIFQSDTLLRKQISLFLPPQYHSKRNEKRIAPEELQNGSFQRYF